MSKTPKNENCKTLIYVLKDPDTDAIRYVGKTVDKLENRLKGHIYRCKLEQNHRAYWIKSLIDNGKTPKIEEIDNCIWTESQQLEIYYIKYYKDLGCDLVNSTEGGEGNLGLVKSQESIEKLKKSLRKNSKPVYQYDLQGNFIQEWENIPVAGETLKITTAGIRRCALGERKKYKEFIWSFEKLDKVVAYEKVTCTPTKKGYTHSNLAKLIKLEENTIRAKNIYVYYLTTDEDGFLFEGKTLKDTAEFLIDNNYSKASITSLKGKISSCCLTNTPYLETFYFTHDIPEFISKPKECNLINIKAFDLDNNLLFDINGLDNFASILEINKANIINNLKGNTKTLLFNNQKIYLTWEEIK